MAKVVTGLMLAAILLLTGCSGVPTTGPVERVSADPGHINSGVEIAPAPPGSNASPIEVVEGFLHAQASWQPNYQVARAYLTPQAALSWRPEAGVRVYAEGNPVVATDSAAMLRAPVVGTLDAVGAYRQATGVLDHDFGLVQDAQGRWRIGNPPEGLTISEYLFASAFARVTPYFFEPGGQWLVPDPRFFPRGAQAYEGAVRAVLAGPTAWLAPAVRPTGVAAQPAGVAITSSGVVSITLRGAGPGPDQDARARLLTQLVRTFRQFESVSGIEVTWEGGESWSLPPYGRTIPVTAFPDADPVPRQGSRQLFAVAEGRLVREIEGAQPGANLIVAPGVAKAATGAVRSDAVAAAAVSADRGAVLMAPLTENSVTTVLTGAGFGRPNFDRHGALWISDADGVMRVAGHDGSWQIVDLSTLGEGKVQAFRLSPDAARIAIVVARPSGARVLGVARVDRGADGVRVQEWREVTVSTTPVSQASVIDVGWRTPESLLALVGEGRSTQVLAVAQDGSSIASIGPTALADPVELAVAPGVPPMVRTAGGDVWRYNSDFRWSLMGTGTTSVFYPG